MEIKQCATTQQMSQQRNFKNKLKIIEANENGNASYQNLWDTRRAVLRVKFISILAYLSKQESFK